MNVKVDERFSSVVIQITIKINLKEKQISDNLFLEIFFPVPSHQALQENLS